MDNIFFILGMISIMVVAASLLMGLASMSKGGKKHNKISNKMMRMRVIAQGLAIFFLFLAYLTKS